jgi:hypothetical protein
MKEKRKHSRFQSIWYALTGLSIAGLVFTGFEIHGSYQMFGYRAATVAHDVLFTLTLFLGVLYLFWAMVTGNGLKALSEKGPGRNANLVLAALVWGVMALSGGLYIGFVIFHDFFAANVSRAAVAYIHTAGAFLVVSSAVWHLYYAYAAQKKSLPVQGRATEAHGRT